MSETQTQESPVITLHDLLQHKEGEHPSWCAVCHEQSGD